MSKVNLSPFGIPEGHFARFDSEGIAHDIGPWSGPCTDAEAKQWIAVAHAIGKDGGKYLSGFIVESTDVENAGKLAGGIAHKMYGDIKVFEGYVCILKPLQVYRDMADIQPVIPK